ncbi:MAG: glycosyltransferase [Propionibacteriaceae bacterium]|jgi:glycosyltransferase EpsH|nr:glycosyltransferase [Propionibacteriaceae bacterium]
MSADAALAPATESIPHTGQKSRPTNQGRAPLDDEPQFSIIIAVHDAADHLDRCLSSILSQDFIPFEVITVDDGSTDSSRSMLHRYARLDGRIRVVHQRNRGVGAARNTGLDLARGCHVLFMDDDDHLIDAGALSRLATAVARTSADVVVFDYVYFAGRRRVIRSWGHADGELRPARLTDLAGVVTELARRRLLLPVWNKAYRRRFLEESGLRFGDARVGEDGQFNFDAFRSARMIAVMNECAYAYCVRLRSAMTTFRPARLTDDVAGIRASAEFFRDVGAHAPLAQRDTITTAVREVRSALSSAHPLRALRVCVSHPGLRAELASVKPADCGGDSRLLLALVALKALWWAGPRRSEGEA